MARTVTLPPRKVRTTVVALQGHPIAPDMPAVGDTLVWDGNEWTPTPAIGRSNRAGETLNLQTTVVGIQGTPVFPVASFLAPGDALLWTGVDWKNYPVAKDLSAANLGPYLPISAYNPSGDPAALISTDPGNIITTGSDSLLYAASGGGGGGNFLPLTGGVLSGPGALTVGDALTLAGAASAGGNSFIDMQGGSAVVQADGNGLLLQQLGDQYGLTSLLIANRDGLNGAMFTNEGLDLVDFAFQTSAGVTGTLRLDARSIPTGQFSFMLSGGTLMTIDSAGNVVCTGTLVRPGFTDGSNAAAGMVGEYLTNTSGSAGIGEATWTSTAVLTLTPGDWECEGTVSYAPTVANNAGVYAGIGPNINTAPSTYNSITGDGGLGGISIPAPRTRFNITSNLTIYLQAFIYLGTGTTCNVGGALNARRMR